MLTLKILKAFCYKSCFVNYFFMRFFYRFILYIVRNLVKYFTFSSSLNSLFFALTNLQALILLLLFILNHFLTILRLHVQNLTKRITQICDIIHHKFCFCCYFTYHAYNINSATPFFIRKFTNYYLSRFRRLNYFCWNTFCFFHRKLECSFIFLWILSLLHLHLKISHSIPFFYLDGWTSK